MWSAKQVTYNKHIHPTGNKWSGHNIVQWFGKHVLFIRWMELNHQSFKTEPVYISEMIKVQPITQLLRMTAYKLYKTYKWICQDKASKLLISKRLKPRNF